MTFEEFENAGATQLRAEAKTCFGIANDPLTVNEFQVAKLLEAQFYMQELGRREDSKIATRDFWLEIAVIGLICIEILLSIWGIKLAIKQGADEDALMDKQNGILTNLQKSTSDTAAALTGLATFTKAMSDNTSASSQTLLSLRSTTETMNKGVHDQLSLFYDPSIVLTYDGGLNRILLTNTGRTRLTITTLKVNGQIPPIPGQKLIPSGSSMYLEYSDNYKSISSTLLKGSALSVPVEAHFDSEMGKHFVLNGSLFFVWDNDKVVGHGQNTSVSPEK